VFSILTGVGMSASRHLIALVACLGAFGCHQNSTAPASEHPALLIRVHAPASVVPAMPFSVTGYFGHGACDTTRPVSEVSSSGARLGLHVTTNIPPGEMCIDILRVDSVQVEVVPPYTLPYTVRLERYMMPDSVVVITSR
jgi:hypothetical protein